MSINPDIWIHEANEQEPGAFGWQNGRTAPERTGMYERYFTDGIFRAYWDGENWLHANRKSAHWRQVGDYPAWRECEPGQTYIILCRNKAGDIIPVMMGDRIAEYSTEQEAQNAANNTMACRALSHSIIGIDL